MKDRTWRMAIWGKDWSELSGRGTSVQGICSFNDRDGITLSIPFGRLRKKDSFSFGGIEFDTGGLNLDNRLVGMTQDGCRLILIGCRSNGVSNNAPGGEEETIAASTVFSAKHDYDESLPIVSAELEIYGLQGWLGKWVSYRPSDDGVIPVKYEKVEHELQLFQGREFSMSIKYGLCRPRLWRECLEVQSFAHVSVCCPNGMSLDCLWHDVVWKTQSLFAFMYGFYPSVEMLRVKFEGCDLPVSVYRQTYVSNDGKVAECLVPVSFESLGGEGLQRLAARWFTLKEKEQRAAEILTTLSGGWTMPFELPLTAASAMLEALGGVHEKKPYSKQEFRAIRDAIAA